MFHCRRDACFVRKTNFCAAIASARKVGLSIPCVCLPKDQDGTNSASTSNSIWCGPIRSTPQTGACPGRISPKRRPCILDATLDPNRFAGSSACEPRPRPRHKGRLRLRGSCPRHERPAPWHHRRKWVISRRIGIAFPGAAGRPGHLVQSEYHAWNSLYCSSA